MVLGSNPGKRTANSLKIRCEAAKQLGNLATAYARACNTTMDQLRHLVARDYPTMLTGCPRVGFISVIANQSNALLSTCSGQFLLVGNAMRPWGACLHVPYAP
jgi:hypothetical protein